MYIESLEIKKNKELRPCPFCGSDDVVLEWYIHHADQRRVRCLCTNCMAMVDAGWWQDERQPIQAWNRRAPAPRNWIEAAIGKEWVWPPVRTGQRDGRDQYSIKWADGTEGDYYIDYDAETIETIWEEPYEK